MDDQLQISMPTLCLILLRLSQLFIAGASQVELESAVDDQYTLIQGRGGGEGGGKGWVRLSNGTEVEVYPADDGSVKLMVFKEGRGPQAYNNLMMKRKRREQLKQSGRVLIGDAGGGGRAFRMCSRCRCCDGSGSLCLRLPCCFSINCAYPNQPFGLCSLTPFSCNCFSC